MYVLLLSVEDTYPILTEEEAAGLALFFSSSD